MLVINIQKCKHLMLDKTGSSTTSKLSQLSGVSIPTLDNYVAGRAFMSGNADKIAKALGVSVLDILEDRGE